jgi:hypothetical protein
MFPPQAINEKSIAHWRNEYKKLDKLYRFLYRLRHLGNLYKKR